MILEQQKIDTDKVRCVGNNVLVKVKVHNDRIILKGGLELFLDVSFKRERHSSVNCEVVAVPDHLVFSDDIDHMASMPHLTPMELQPKDTVIIKYLAFFGAMSETQPKYFRQDDELYFFVNYADCYVAKREATRAESVLLELMVSPKLEQSNCIMEDGKYYWVYPLNGILLCEELDEVIHTDLIIPNTAKKKDKKTCIVSFSGTPNQAYWKSDTCDDPAIKNGMRIIVEKNSLGRYLEPPEHLSFNGKKIYNIVERHLVNGYYEN